MFGVSIQSIYIIRLFFSLTIIVPGAPELTLIFVTADSVSFSWTVPNGTVVEGYELKWSIEKQVELRTLSQAMNSYTISELGMYDNTTIEILVTAINDVGRRDSNPLTIHSDFIQNGPKKNSATNINIGIIIGGAVGVFLIGLTIGIIAGIIVFKLIHNCRNRKKRY